MKDSQAREDLTELLGRVSRLEDDLKKAEVKVKGELALMKSIMEEWRDGNTATFGNITLRLRAIEQRFVKHCKTCGQVIEEKPNELATTS